MADKSDNFFKGFVIGGIVGAFVGLMLAPKSGKELRSELSEESEKFLGKAREDIEHAKKAAIHAYESSRDRIAEKLHKDQLHSRDESPETVSDSVSATETQSEEIPAPKKRKSRKSKS
jgi:gas vesicle protein